jgi:hypothetical protein
MFRLNLAAGAAIICLLLGRAPQPSDAGNYHAGDTAVCADCHENGTRLTRQDVNRTCLSCHGNAAESTTPSVLELNPSGMPRQAGALNGAGGTLRDHTGHTLGGPDAAPGGTWTPGIGGMTCTDCHAAHGDPAQYRNLVVRPGTAETDRRITFSSGPANDRRRDVWLKPAPTMAGRYAAENVQFNQADSTQSPYAAWCQGCHTQFHGAAGSSNMGGMFGGEIAHGWLRHPTVGVAVGARGNRHSSFTRYASLQNRVQTLSASGAWPAPDNTVSCMSCHKAHGNRNPFGLLYMSGRGLLTEDGDSGGGKYTHLCQQCHMEGLS